MRAKILGLTGAALGAVMAFSAPASADIIAGDPSLTNYQLLYGDFEVVSLQFALDATGDSQFNVQSGAGQVKDYLVIGLGSGTPVLNGQAGGSMTLAGSDAPYSTESGSTDSFFRTGSTTNSPDPGGPGEFNGVNGDTDHSWDISLSTLQDYLNGDRAVFYFTMSDTGVDDTIAGTDELIWIKMTLTNSTTGPQATDPVFYLTGSPFDGGAGMTSTLTNGAPNEEVAVVENPAPGMPGYVADPRWTYIHGNICVDGSLFQHYGSCDGRAGETAGSHSIKQDVGQDEAAFAGYNLTLADLINNPPAGYDTLQIDWRMKGLDDGPEKLFILAGGTPTIVPEPFTMSLFGAGIVGLGLLRRRKAGKSKA